MNGNTPIIPENPQNRLSIKSYDGGSSNLMEPYGRETELSHDILDRRLSQPIDYLNCQPLLDIVWEKTVSLNTRFGAHPEGVQDIYQAFEDELKEREGRV